LELRVLPVCWETRFLILQLWLVRFNWFNFGGVALEASALAGAALGASSVFSRRSFGASSA
jgi:hypothetical protein